MLNDKLIHLKQMCLVKQIGATRGFQRKSASRCICRLSAEDVCHTPAGPSGDVVYPLELVAISLCHHKCKFQFGFYYLKNAKY